MRLWIDRGQRQGVKKSLQERRDLITSQKTQLQNDHQAYVKLLKNVKQAICNRQAKEERLSGVLGVIEQKLDELHHHQIESAGGQIGGKQLNLAIDIKQSYSQSTSQYKIQVE